MTSWSKKVKKLDLFDSRAFAHHIGTDIGKDITIWIIQFDHIEISTRKYSCSGERISWLEFCLQCHVIIWREIKVEVTDMMAIWVRLTDIEVCVDAFRTCSCRFEYYRFVEFEVFLIRIIARFGESFSEFYEPSVFIIIVAEYPEIPRVIEISTKRIHAEFTTLSTALPDVS